MITALTAQNTKGVTGIHDVPPEFIGEQIDAVFSDLVVDAVKIGMLSTTASIEAVTEGLDRHGQTKVVLDPVMVATSGDRLLQPDAVEMLVQVADPARDGDHAEPAGGSRAGRPSDRRERVRDARPGRTADPARRQERC